MSQQALNRWGVAYTLVNNPGLVQYTASKLALKKSLLKAGGRLLRGNTGVTNFDVETTVDLVMGEMEPTMKIGNLGDPDPDSRDTKQDIPGNLDTNSGVLVENLDIIHAGVSNAPNNSDDTSKA